MLCMVVASPRIKAFQGAGEMEPMTAVGQAHHFRDARAMYVLPPIADMAVGIDL